MGALVGFKIWIQAGIWRRIACDGDTEVDELKHVGFLSF